MLTVQVVTAFSGKFEISQQNVISIILTFELKTKLSKGTTSS